jgi:hypothetical protein
MIDGDQQRTDDQRRCTGAADDRPLGRKPWN